MAISAAPGLTLWIAAGRHVVLEFAADGIYVLPAMVEKTKTEIEGRVLHYLLRNLGDAVGADAQEIEGLWRV